MDDGTHKKLDALEKELFPNYDEKTQLRPAYKIYKFMQVVAGAELTPKEILNLLEVAKSVKK